MKYLDEIKELEKKLEENNKDLVEIQKEWNQEIESAKKQINLKYEANFNQNKLEKNELIEKYSKIVELAEKYSKFFESELAQVLAELINVYKQDEYISYLANIKIPFINDILETKRLITPKYEKKEEFSEENYDTYINDHSDTLVTFNNIKDYLFITVYTRYTKDFIIYPNLIYNIIHNNDINNPKNLLFIKEFIDYVINYRIDNKMDKISLEELEALKDEFINSHQVEIEEYHKNNNLTLKRER